METQTPTIICDLCGSAYSYDVQWNRWLLRWECAPCRGEPTPTPGAPLAASNPTCARCHTVIVAEAGDTCANIPHWQRGAFAYCTEPALPAYNPEDGAPCAQCGHGQELHMNGTEECWESDATLTTFCPCPRFQAREAAQRADEATMPTCAYCAEPIAPNLSAICSYHARLCIPCASDEHARCTRTHCACGCQDEGTPEGDAARWLANRGLPPMAGGAPSHYTDPAWLADEAWARQAERNAESTVDLAWDRCKTRGPSDLPCIRQDDHDGWHHDRIGRRWPYGCTNHYGDLNGGPNASCPQCEHTHPCPTCRVARPCTGTGCADGPRECSTCSQCRGW